eukprot:CAMPEP_0119004520 /NCGR_PEP_ID=MMETSP1176-20130426/1190_1 /TAXON_ID=265551 /ORGANISM="Synedropsis recta cf, Strain CCMP1620" /LENGTH=299 /DNA_ID=CAMNT_0006956233 /DNA_START=75 /DNA_END=974 /DNA_ORIENTATION=-
MTSTLLTALILASLLDEAVVQAFLGHVQSQKITQTRLQSTLFNDAATLSTGDSVISNIDNSPYLLFPGGGLFFYWQAGVVSYLREQDRYNLDNVRLGGASAGALTATLTAANVDFYEATESALLLAKDAGVWDRSGGLQGIWGPMIENWLDELLPDDVLERVNGRLSLLVTEIPSFSKTRVDTFQSRKDLIDCNMASVHLPWFLDGKLTARFREAEHIDGSFFSQVSDYGVTTNDRIIMPDYQEDPAMDLPFFDFVSTVSPDSIYEMLEKGKAHAKVMEEQGQFKDIDVAELRSIQSKL